MDKPLIFYRADRCPICNAENAVEAYNNWGKPIGLTRYLNSESNDDLRKKFIYRLQCRGCGQNFFPIWIDNIPYPSVDRDADIFLNSYKQYKNVDP